ncbi:30S ribosomal protein S16 [bacterium BMS3Abin05]|nr:30S ribosomal protein S16 [bacterium BMS3Abin05]HDL78483.1 30S ribosomal protein S16 [Bacteroidota bacterium]
MSVRLRLARMGRKKRPFYRVVAVDSRKRRDGKYIENLGYYDPLTDPIDVKLKEERIFYWLKVGAQPSETVRNLLRQEGILFKWDLMKKGFDEARIQEELGKLEVIQLERRRKAEQIKEKEKPAEAAKEEIAEAAAPEEVKTEKPAADEEISAAAVETKEEAAEDTAPKTDEDSATDEQEQE